MHQRKGKKILLYFFLLCLVGSINNNQFISIKFEEVKDVNVLGLGQRDNQSLLTEIKNLNLNNLFFINEIQINNLISSNNLVQDYEIFKRYPSTLDINIKKTKFLAKINHKKEIFLVGANGKLSNNNQNNNSLPFIFGKPKIHEFLNFKEIIDHSELSYEKVKNLYFYPSGRWDIELKDNRIIKLSSYFDKHTLNFVLDFLQNKNFKNIKVVDARIDNQIIIND